VLLESGNLALMSLNYGSRNLLLWAPAQSMQTISKIDRLTHKYMRNADATMFHTDINTDLSIAMESHYLTTWAGFYALAVLVTVICGQSVVTVETRPPNLILRYLPACFIVF
jgi:hypothetical protein